MRFMTSSGILRGCAVLAAAAGMFWALVVRSAPAGAAAGPAPPPAITATEVDRAVLMSAMIRAGITPEALAASGVSAEEVPALVARAADHLSTAEWALDSADELCRTHDSEVWRLEEAANTGTSQEGDAALLQEARTQATQAAASRATILDGIFNSATDGLAAEKIQILDTIRGNRVQGVETELLLLQRNREGWSELREAISMCRPGQRRQPPAEASRLLAEARADPAVVAARQRLTALPSLLEAWRTATSPR